MAWEAGSREMRQFPVPTLFSGPRTVHSQDLQSLAIMKPPHCEETKLLSEPRGRLRTIFNQTRETYRDELAVWNSDL